MTTIAQALRTVSLGLAELAEALEGSDLPPLPVTTAIANDPAHYSADGDPRGYGDPPKAAAVAQVLGECPVHQTAWVLKEGGISSKTGKAYKAFWKCDGKNADGSFCQKKPALEWVRTHDPEAVAW